MSSDRRTGAVRQRRQSKEQPGARVRALAAEVVDAVTASGQSLDDALKRAEEKLPASEHALLRMLCFGTLRKYWRLKSWIDVLTERPLKPADRLVGALLAVGLFQLSGTRVPEHAAVSATVEATRLINRPKHAGLVNAILRRFMREQIVSQPAASDEARFNHPAWMIDTLRADWPDDWQQILEANDERAPLWLRVNRQRISTDGYLARLLAAGIPAAR
nr:transcription antitermination factor NusB [Woeseiaceae bacterium]